MQAHLIEDRTEWLKWRRQGVGASEVPTLMGESEYSTPLEIWKIKTGRKPEQESNWAMRRGSSAEPTIRAQYERRVGVKAPQALGVHSGLSYHRASFDALIQAGEGAAEFKYPGAEKHEQAKCGEIPLCYKGQVQAQILVGDLRYGDYVSFDGAQIAVVRAFPDHEYISRMKEVVGDFWNNNVLKDTPPPISDLDYLEEVNPNVRGMIREFKTMKLGGANEYRLKVLREAICLFLSHPRYRIEGVKILRNKNGVFSFTIETNVIVVPKKPLKITIKK